MSHSCSEYRERWFDGDRVDGSTDAELVRHRAECAECAGFSRRTEATIASLRGLASIPAPHELEGFAVAAMQAGQRQERATAALRCLMHAPAPLELDEIMWRKEGPLRAPLVLDRLVSEDLEDQSQALTRRFTSRLERLSAPHSLRQRLATAGGLDPIPGRRIAFHATALALIFVAVTLFAIGRVRTKSAEQPQAVIVIEKVDSIDDLDPFVRGEALALVGGGILDLRSLSASQPEALPKRVAPPKQELK